MIFLKLGGSLITDKAQPQTVRPEVLARLAQEIAQALDEQSGLRLVIGHGSGSFGHPVAVRYGTQRGAVRAEEWLGFAEVWAAANQLHRLVVDALRQAHVPALGLPPSASTIAEDGEIVEMMTEPVQRALQAGLVPVVGGDVAFDRRRGATIVSTERIFGVLAERLRPNRVLLAGREPGVFADHPADTRLLEVLTDRDLESLAVGKSDTPDVTGGMADKVRWALKLARAIPGLEVRIFSGDPPGQLRAALLGGHPGTLIRPE